MKRLLFVLLLSTLAAAQTYTFTPLVHFPGTPTNPCVATTFAQNDAADQLYGCDVNTLNWYQIGAGASSGAASPGIGFPARFWYTYGDSSAILSIPGGNNAAVGLGTQGASGTTATETQGRSMSNAAGASVNFVLGLESGCGASFGAGAFTWGTLKRFSMRLTTTVSSTARYWVGVSDCRSGDFAGGSATYATDTPNLNYCMFRFSTTTDTTWKAICATSNVAQTVVDTGVAIATSSSTMFEIIPNSTATAATFYLNGNQVATISTNIMATSQQLGQMYAADNKNSATTEQVNFYWSEELFTK
jgi:hypothetical protein